MKRRLYLVALVLTALSAFAGESTDSVAAPVYRNVYFEIYGASNWFGVSYDSRIKAGSPFGYRTGLSFISDYNYPYRTSGCGIPLEMNVILGKRASKFEAAVGADLIFYRKSVNPHYSRSTYLRSGFGYYTYINIGYRLQYRNGFNFRVGYNYAFAWGNHAVYKGPGFYLWPYTSFGYTF